MARLVSLEFKKRDVTLKNIPKFYKTLAENKMSIGVHKEQGSFNVQKATWNEFGNTKILSKDVRKRLANGTYVTLKSGTKIVTPARPFVRIYFYPEKMKKLFDAFRDEINFAFYKGLDSPIGDARETLKNTALIGEAEMRKTIMTNDLLLPNADLTVAIKGFDYPLFRYGKMMNAIKGKVEKR